jgi:hypothetical protein
LNMTCASFFRTPPAMFAGTISPFLFQALGRRFILFLS